MCCRSTQHEIARVADCVKNGKTLLTNGRASLWRLRVTWALYNAEQNNMLADLRGMGIADNYDY